MMSSVLASLLYLATPLPTPPPEFDVNTVTPTWVGFGITFLVAAVTVLLIMDMVRRIRRVRYQAEVRELLEAEREAGEEN